MLLRFALVLLLYPLALRGAEVEFARVWPQWRDAESFDRISEYSGGARIPAAGWCFAPTPRSAPATILPFGSQGGPS
jgi:hypothetical protein